MILLVHEIKPWMLKVSLPFDIITFDDALYSQWFYIDHFLKLKKRLIVFVSTGIICPENQKQILNITCREAHTLFFTQRDAGAYMTKRQILELYNKGVEIGLHGVTHSHLSSTVKGMQQAMQEAIESYQTLLSWGIKATTMSYPYNEPNIGFKILNRYGFEFFGSERIPIETYRCQQLKRNWLK